MQNNYNEHCSNYNYDHFYDRWTMGLGPLRNGDRLSEQEELPSHYHGTREIHHVVCHREQCPRTTLTQPNQRGIVNSFSMQFRKMFSQSRLDTMKENLHKPTIFLTCDV